jgi:hypothetical protein
VLRYIGDCVRTERHQPAASFIAGQTTPDPDISRIH